MEHTRQQLEEIKDRLAKLPNVTHTLLTIGDTSGKQTRATGDVTKGSIYVRMLDIDERRDKAKGGDPKATQFTNQATARKIMADYPDLRSSVQVPSAMSSGSVNADVELTISGPEFNELMDVSRKLMARMRETPGLTDVDTTLPERNPELRVMIDRVRAKDLDLDIRTIASTLQVVVGGQIVSDYKDDTTGEQYDVWLRGAMPDRNTREAIATARIMSPTAGLVELSNVARLEEARGPAQIDHYQRQRKVSVIANRAFYDKHNQFLFLNWTTREQLPVGDAMVAINKLIDDLRASGEMSPMDTTEFLGRAKTQSQMMGAFLMAFGLSLVFMYMILAAQFESFVHPITILLAVPLTIPFAIISLVLLGEAMTFFGILGVFLLFGVVKKNGILQVDYANQMRAKGMPIREAVLEANKTRLRPILMTTVMLVAGMMPIALGQGAGSAARSSMAKVIVGGQALSLLLTLLVTPVAYTLFDDLARNVKTAFRAIFGESPTAQGFTPTAAHATAPAQGEEERPLHSKTKQSPVGLN